MYPQFFKPLIDKTIAGVLLLLTLPITLLVSGLLYFYNDGKPFFFQLRPGLRGQIFRIWKFKTMNDRKNKQGQLLPDHERLTAVGKWVRKTSLDELPQLINVLKGDMSLVGPRPLLVEYLPLYNLRQQRRHEVKPGITGWAQVNGRNAISWQQKFEYDVWYVENLSFFLDLKILWLTAMKVVKSEGINASQTTTMKKFMGNN
ncbi:lipopolysaccharide/colanic/teichoic acid biosynthesis glycosyltransferase [Runella defluvii]|uniref:Lipopolysaccharide/colanic/teichoic acid biosynthesis glycosyltransferase n=1 Tax=Runella defluvii TaxID=370973 RepID=A0A7W6ETB4_9BACT|nr:sugar transferase [Runella defluvii]MBB3841231.1 lipopolysaccharide/colanic/teichoic acid biosynthesis glycosyltransferase [Runella defluvii]